MNAFLFRRNFSFKNRTNFLTNKLFSTINSNNFLLNSMKLNIYNGVVIDMNSPSIITQLKVEENYDQLVKSTLTELKAKGIQSVIITVPINISYFIHFLTSNDFYFHHSAKDKVVLCKWLNDKTENKIPNYGHYSVGIGAVIFNKNFEILLIKEKYNTSIWKFVTGLVEIGETIHIATLREAKEEVGLNDIEYLGNYYLREVYPLNQMNDICFFNLCYHKGENNELKIDPNELFQAQYIPLKECENLTKNNQTTIITKLIIDNFSKDLNEFQEDQNKKNKNSNINEFIKYIGEKKLFKKRVFNGTSMNFKVFEHYYI